MISIKEQKGGRAYIRKIKKRKKKGLSQVGVGAWVSFFYLSKCHFGRADLSGFSI